jgi:hypothetical protein
MARGEPRAADDHAGPLRERRLAARTVTVRATEIVRDLARARRTIALADECGSALTDLLDGARVDHNSRVRNARARFYIAELKAFTRALT